MRKSEEIPKGPKSPKPQTSTMEEGMKKHKNSTRCVKDGEWNGGRGGMMKKLVLQKSNECLKWGGVSRSLLWSWACMDDKDK